MSEDKKGALILTHKQDEGSCTLGQTISDRGMRIKTINVPRAGLEGIDALRPDLMVVMGGPIGVYQADYFPFLKTEIEMLKARIAADKPTIGICLGSQLIATALGATVVKGDAGMEMGWSPLTLTDAAKGTEAELLCGSKTNMLHWHGDTFNLPEGATLLASSEKYKHQIFVYGQNILGIQSHPEVQPPMLEEWFVTFNADITGPNPKVPIAKLREDNACYGDDLKKQASAFFNAWLENRSF